MLIVDLALAVGTVHIETGVKLKKWRKAKGEGKEISPKTITLLNYQYLLFYCFKGVFGLINFAKL